VARSLRPYGPGTARFSSCETWRYELTRDLSVQPFKRKRSGVLLSIGLNPSTATCDDDDPTVHKESGLALAWGYALYIKTNAYGFRAMQPPDMFAARARGIDIVGADNDAAIREGLSRVAREGGRVLATWGQNIDAERQREVAQLLKEALPFSSGRQRGSEACQRLLRQRLQRQRDSKDE
jgi:hypothetical protein